MAYGTIIEWGADFVSAAFFVGAAPVTVSVSELFSLAYGVKPTQINENRHPGGWIGTAGNSDGAVTKTIQIQPGRIDLVISGAEAEFSSNPSPLSIQDVTVAMDELLAAARKIVSQFNVFVRLAVNCRLARHEKNIKDANKALLSVFPYKIPLDQESDFIFQINNGKQMPKFFMNRIVKWSVENIQILAATNPFGQLSSISSEQLVGNFYSGIVHMDFNSAPSHITWNADQVSEMLDIISSEVLRVRRSSLRF